MKRLRSTELIRQLREQSPLEREESILARKRANERTKQEYRDWCWSQMTLLRWLALQGLIDDDARLLIGKNLIFLYFQRTLQPWNHLAENPTLDSPLTLFLTDGLTDMCNQLLEHILRGPNRLHVQIYNLRYSMIRRVDDLIISNKAFVSLEGDPTTNLKHWVQRTLPTDLIIVRYTLGSDDSL